MRLAGRGGRCCRFLDGMQKGSEPFHQVSVEPATSSIFACLSVCVKFRVLAVFTLPPPRCVLPPPQQTAEAGASHQGRRVAITSQPVMLQLDDVSPPPYSEIAHAPPPSYLDATRQNARPREVETVPVSAQRGVEDPADGSCNCLDGKTVLSLGIAGCCVAGLVCALCA